MRKFFGLAAAALMTVAAPVPAASNANAAPSSQGGNAELFAFCNELTEEFPGLSLGECMSFNLTQGTYGFVPHMCDELRELGLLEDYGFSSYSDCVRNAR